MKKSEEFKIKKELSNNDMHVDISGVVPKDLISSKKEKVLSDVAKGKKMDGFRSGKVPKNLVEKDMSQLEIWTMSAKEALSENLPSIFLEEKLAPVDIPNITFTKVPNGEDVEFSLSFEVIPLFDLPDYKSILKNVGKMEIAEEATSEDISNALLNVRRGLYKKRNEGMDIPEDESKLPEITDEVVKEISIEHKDVESFKESLLSSITREKGLQKKIEYRQKIIESIMSSTDIKVPEQLVKKEAERSFEELKKEAESLKTTVEKYLEHRKITEEDLNEELEKDALKRIKVQLTMNAVSRKENILPDPVLVQKEVDRFKAKQTGMSEDELRVYISSLLSNEEVMNFLEKIASGVEK